MLFYLKSKKMNTHPMLKLIKDCATRWIQCYEALNDFCELILYVYKTLNFISFKWKDSSATDASMLLKCIQDSEFLVSFYVTKVCKWQRQLDKDNYKQFNSFYLSYIFFSYGLPVRKQLQKEKIDLKKNNWHCGKLNTIINECQTECWKLI